MQRPASKRKARQIMIERLSRLTPEMSGPTDFGELMRRIAERLTAMAVEIESNQARLGALTWSTCHHDAEYVKVLQNADLLAQGLTEIGRLVKALSASSATQSEIETALRSITLQGLALQLGSDGPPAGESEADDICFF